MSEFRHFRTSGKAHASPEAAINELTQAMSPYAGKRIFLRTVPQLISEVDFETKATHYTVVCRWSVEVSELERQNAQNGIFLPELGATSEERERAINAALSPRGGWTAKSLRKWGVSWPPPKGWRKALIRGEQP